MCGPVWQGSSPGSPRSVGRAEFASIAPLRGISVATSTEQGVIGVELPSRCGRHPLVVPFLAACGSSEISQHASRVVGQGRGKRVRVVEECDTWVLTLNQRSGPGIAACDRSNGVELASLGDPNGARRARRGHARPAEREAETGNLTLVRHADRSPSRRRPRTHACPLGTRRRGRTRACSRRSAGPTRRTLGHPRPIARPTNRRSAGALRRPAPPLGSRPTATGHSRCPFAGDLRTSRPTSASALVRATRSRAVSLPPGRCFVAIPNREQVSIRTVS